MEGTVALVAVDVDVGGVGAMGAREAGTRAAAKAPGATADGVVDVGLSPVAASGRGPSPGPNDRLSGVASASGCGDKPAG